jgi:flagellar protein FliO/FliZ
MNGLFAIVIVLALVATLGWLLRSGYLGRFVPKSGPVGVETAISLGERRQLVIVAVEGRRLLLGVTSAQVTLLTELQPRSAAPSAFHDALERAAQVAQS